MTENAKRIWQTLTAAGMSEAGAAAMLGNMQAESALRADNAQDGMTRLSDADYTAQVDNGIYANFARDAVGYGLCQWTFSSRKAALLAFARSRGTSIGDLDMQAAFTVKELKEDFPGLWKFLCIAEDINAAAGRICREYERPAVDNSTERAEYARKWYEEFYSQFVKNSEKSCNSADKSSDAQMCTVQLPVVKLGSKGFPVWLLQTLLNRHEFYVKWTDGDFGPNTLEKVKAFQTAKGLSADGIVGCETWAKLLKR